MRGQAPLTLSEVVEAEPCQDCHDEVHRDLVRALEATRDVIAAVVITFDPTTTWTRHVWAKLNELADVLAVLQ